MSINDYDVTDDITTATSKDITLEILDTAGRDEFMPSHPIWIREGHGFLLVYSIECRPTFDELNNLS